MKKALLFMKYKFISIEGNIGAGKTSLATNIAFNIAKKAISEILHPTLEWFFKLKNMLFL